MSGLTLAQAEERLAGWLTADAELQNGQSFRWNDRLLTQADAAEVRTNIDYWNKKCAEIYAAESGRGRSRVASPNW